MTTEQLYPCPSCGFLVFGEPPGSYEICPVCNWEDDCVQLASPGMRGGANKESLKEYQDGILEKIPPHVMQMEDLERDPEWRPLEKHEVRRWPEAQETNTGASLSAWETPPVYYWKKKRS